MLGQCPRGSPSPLFYGVICYNRTMGCRAITKYKKMVFPAAIREKSQRGVALSCDAQVVSAKSVGIRQPCTKSRSESASCETFFSVQHFCAGNFSGRRYKVTCAYLFMFSRRRYKVACAYLLSLATANTPGDGPHHWCGVSFIFGDGQHTWRRPAPLVWRIFSL